MVITQHQASRQVDNGRWVSLGADHGIHLWQCASGIHHALAALEEHPSGCGIALARMFPRIPLGGVMLAIPVPGTVLSLPLHEVTALDEVDLLVKANHHHATEGTEELWFYDGELHWVDVEHHGQEILVHPPPAMFKAMARLHALRQVAVEA